MYAVRYVLVNGMVWCGVTSLGLWCPEDGDGDGVRGGEVGEWWSGGILNCCCASDVGEHKVLRITSGRD